MARMIKQHVRHEFRSALTRCYIDIGLSGNEWKVVSTSVSTIPGKRVRDDIIVFTHLVERIRN